ncbi:MAG: transcriptional regulator, partial [Gemmatimonadetes bacterium]
MSHSPTAFTELDDQALAIFQRFGTRWTMVVASLIEPGPIRFGELHRNAKGISRKMLTQTLRSLERDGVIERRVITNVPLAVEYTFTELGWSLCP